jgi:hypothetical protein
MVGTAYNGELFFVRHCYFTGAHPYQQLKRACKGSAFDGASRAHPLRHLVTSVPATGNMPDGGQGVQPLRGDIFGLRRLSEVGNRVR